MLDREAIAHRRQPTDSPLPAPQTAPVLVQTEPREISAWVMTKTRAADRSRSEN
jgi:hypothetical protein